MTSDLGFVDSLPIAAVYVGIALLIVVACEAGFMVGHYHGRKRKDDGAPGSIGPMVGGLLGMLAFVLSMTFSMAATEYAGKRKNVLLEANSISTAYLRSDLVDDRYGASIKQLLREYAGLRLKVAHGVELEATLLRSAEIHRLLWTQASAAAAAGPTSSTGLVLEAINDVIDMHETRITDALHSRIPFSVWLALMAITLLTMVTLGMQVGLSGKRRMVAVVPLSMAFAVLATLVVELDRPRGRLVSVGQQAMIDVQNDMDRNWK